MYKTQLKCKSAIPYIFTGNKKETNDLQTAFL